MKPTIHNAHLQLQHLSFGGLPLDAMAYVIATAVREKTIKESIWVVLPDEQSSITFVENLHFWLGDRSMAHHFPSDESDCFQGVSPARHLPQQRLIALQHLYSSAPSILVSSVFGAMHRVYSEQTLSQTTLTLKKDHCYEPTFIMEWLSHTGYLNTHRLDEEGHFRRTGDTLHLWPIGAQHPYRLSFFDEELEFWFVEIIRLFCKLSIVSFSKFPGIIIN